MTLMIECDVCGKCVPNDAGAANWISVGRDDGPWWHCCTWGCVAALGKRRSQPEPYTLPDDQSLIGGAR